MLTRRGILAAGAAVGLAGRAPAAMAQSALPFVVRGRVVDGQGRPIAGAQIIVDNEFLYNSNVTGRTAADGTYRIQLPRVASTWNVTAKMMRTVNGRAVEMDLHPDNPDSFAGNQGAVRNFSLRTSGARPGGGSYGASAIVYTPAVSMLDQREVTLTFTPSGGGAPITAPVVSTPDGYGVRDLPLGLYTITGRTPRGPVRIRKRGQGAFGRSVTAEFEAVTNTLYQVELEVSE